METQIIVPPYSPTLSSLPPPTANRQPPTAHRYHLLHPEYLLARIKEQQRAWGLVVVLCHIDVEDMIKPLAAVTKAAVINGCTLICAWSPEVRGDRPWRVDWKGSPLDHALINRESGCGHHGDTIETHLDRPLFTCLQECARYLETLKSYESKPASSIQERVEHDYASRQAAALTQVRGVNRWAMNETPLNSIRHPFTTSRLFLPPMLCQNRRGHSGSGEGHFCRPASLHAPAAVGVPRHRTDKGSKAI